MMVKNILTTSVFVVTCFAGNQIFSMKESPLKTEVEMPTKMQTIDDIPDFCIQVAKKLLEQQEHDLPFLGKTVRNMPLEYVDAKICDCMGQCASVYNKNVWLIRSYSDSHPDAEDVVSLSIYDDSWMCSIEELGAAYQNVIKNVVKNGWIEILAIDCPDEVVEKKFDDEWCFFCKKKVLLHEYLLIANMILKFGLSKKIRYYCPIWFEKDEKNKENMYLAIKKKEIKQVLDIFKFDVERKNSSEEKIIQ